MSVTLPVPKPRRRPGDLGVPAAQAALAEGALDLARPEGENGILAGNCRGGRAEDVVPVGRAAHLPLDATIVGVERPADLVARNEVDQPVIDRRAAGAGGAQVLLPDLGPGGGVERGHQAEARGDEDLACPVGEPAAAGIGAGVVGRGEVAGPQKLARGGDGADAGLRIEGEDTAAGHHRIGGDAVALAVAGADVDRPGQAGRGAERGVRCAGRGAGDALRPVGIGAGGRQAERRGRRRRLVRGQRGFNVALGQDGVDILTLSGQDDLFLFTGRQQDDARQSKRNRSSVSTLSPPSLVRAARAGPG